ncbi:hypothetical protein BC832DRAFT_589895 [Gaertneriomyces semiglobifer]|nr:hypothetical protein BC832DRAFT_589895 [Gaertneriomyces semiglobifer]
MAYNPHDVSISRLHASKTATFPFSSSSASSRARPRAPRDPIPVVIDLTGDDDDYVPHTRPRPDPVCQRPSAGQKLPTPFRAVSNVVPSKTTTKKYEKRSRLSSTSNKRGQRLPTPAFILPSASRDAPWVIRKDEPHKITSYFGKACEALPDLLTRVGAPSRKKQRLNTPIDPIVRQAAVDVLHRDDLLLSYATITEKSTTQIRIEAARYISGSSSSSFNRLYTKAHPVVPE